MSSPGPTEDERPPIDPATPLCRHLRSKGMYVYTDGSAGEGHDDYDNTIFWCFQTMNSFGPDEDFVSRDECRCVTRTCYEPI